MPTNKLIDLARLSRFKQKIDTLLSAKSNVADVQGTTEDKAINHLGFYLDEDGGLCQKNEI